MLTRIRTVVDTEPTTLSRIGAWGQIGSVALAVAFWSLGRTDVLLAVFVGYLLVTMVGIIGIARTESAIAGPIVYPFMFPGLVPLYYFATR
jgi:hypothetical protein